MAIGSPVSPIPVSLCPVPSLFPHSVPVLCPISMSLSHLCVPAQMLFPSSVSLSPYPFSLSLLPCPVPSLYLSSHALPSSHTPSHLCPYLLFHLHVSVLCLYASSRLHVSVLCPHALSFVSLFPCPIWLLPHGPPMTCHADPTRQDVP